MAAGQGANVTLTPRRPRTLSQVEGTERDPLPAAVRGRCSRGTDFYLVLHRLLQTRRPRAPAPRSCPCKCPSTARPCTTYAEREHTRIPELFQMCAEVLQNLNLTLSQD